MARHWCESALASTRFLARSSPPLSGVLFVVEALGGIGGVATHQVGDMLKEHRARLALTSVRRAKDLSQPTGATLTQTKPHGSYLLSIGCAVLGLFILAVIVYVNLQVGYSLGLSQQGKATQGALSIAIDCGLALFSAVTGYLFVRRPWLAIVPLVVTILCAIYSLGSLVGWSASERVARANLAEASAKAEQKAGERANAEALKQHREMLDWLRATVVKTEDRRERGQLLGAIKDATKEQPNIKAVVNADEIAADAQSDVFSKALAAIGFKVDKNDVMLVVILFGAGLSILVKGTALMFAGYLWPRRAPANSKMVPVAGHPVSSASSTSRQPAGTGDYFRE